MPWDIYDQWLRKTHLIGVDGDEYVIGLPDTRAKDWLENRMTHTLRRGLGSMVGHPVQVRFQVPALGLVE